jgi:hypothetical protein
MTTKTKNSTIKEPIEAEELDAMFDRGEDITDYLDFSKARRPGLEQRRINLDAPVWMIQALDFEARRLGITRQAIIKVWVAERIRQEQLPGANPVAP